MKQIFLLKHQTSWQKFEQEEKANFLKVIFEQLDISYGNVFDSPSQENKLKLKSILDKYKIEILDEDDFSIFVENELIAKMSKPVYKIKKDLAVKSRKDNLYLEVEIDYWSVFENNK